MIDDKFIPRAEAERRAARHGLGPFYVRGAIKRGELPARVVGKSILVRESDLAAWLAAPGDDAAEVHVETEGYRCRATV